MMACDHVGKDTSHNRAGLTLHFGQILLRPQGTGSRMCFFCPTYPALNMRVRVSTLSQISLKTLSKFTKIVPNTR